MPMRLELGSWRVWELWEEEWPDWVEGVARPYRRHWHTLWLALSGRLREKDRNYVLQVLHEGMNIVTETLRAIGMTIWIYAYTIAHVLVLAAGVGVALWMVP